MREIVIEKVMRSDGDSLPLVDQFDMVLRDISFEAGRLADGQEPAGLDTWVQKLRQQFWKRQLEVVEKPTHFSVRMAAPGFGSGQMKVVITEDSVEIRGSGDRVIRQIPLPAEVDPRTVYAVFDDGYLELTGTRFDPEERDPCERSTTEERSASLHIVARGKPERAMAAGRRVS